MKNDVKEIGAALKAGELVVMPTDTIWGILADARNENAVEKLYAVRGRDTDKPCIVLVENAAQIFDVFDVWEALSVRDVLKVLWSETLTPRGKREALIDILSEELLDQMDFHRAVSVVFPVQNEELHYLHRGSDTLAFRVPSRMSPWGSATSDVVKSVGPLVAPSANKQGQAPVSTTKEGEECFGSDVACYAKNVIVPISEAESSHVIKWDGTQWLLLR